MKGNQIRWCVFLFSLTVVAVFDYFEMTNHSSFFKMTNAIAVYFIIYETALQFIRVFYKDIYFYLTKFLNGNIKLNNPIHNNPPLTLFEKTKVALTVVTIHLLSIIFTFYINF